MDYSFTLQLWTGRPQAIPELSSLPLLDVFKVATVLCSL